MKNILAFLVCFYSLSGFCQNSEIQINSRYGISHRNMSINDVSSASQSDYKKLQTINDIGGIMNFKYRVWVKGNLFASVGIEFSSSKYYQPILEYGGSQLANIEIENFRTAYHLGVQKQINLYDDRVILEIGIDAVHRNYRFDVSTYQLGATRAEFKDWIEYEYNFSAFYGDTYKNDLNLSKDIVEGLKLEYSLGVKFRLAEKLYLNSSISYSRNNILFYDYSYELNYYSGGSQTPTNTFIDNGFVDGTKYAIRDHFWYLTLGMAYKFEWVKKNSD